MPGRRLGNLKRKDFLGGSLLFLGGLCSCEAVASVQTLSTCCDTPGLEPESFQVSEEQVTVALIKTRLLDARIAPLAS